MAATRMAKIKAAASIHFRQTKALVKKTYLLLLRKWTSTLVRALLVPVAVMVFLSYAKYLFFPPQSYGLGEPAPIRPLKDTIDGKLVFVRNTMREKADFYISRLVKTEGLSSAETVTVNHQGDLAAACPMNLQGTSSCYAAVMFYGPYTTYTEYNTQAGKFQLGSKGNTSEFNYAILVNPSLASGGNIDIKNHNSPIQSHILPLQWAVDRSAAPESLLESSKPQEWGYTRTTPKEQDQFINQAYLRGVARFIYPAFFIGMIGVLYHLPGLFVAEREIGITSLLVAHGCTTSARYLSWHLSLSALYMPGWLIGGIFFALKLFQSSSPAVIILFQLLGGLSLVSFALFLSAFFRRAQLASVFSATFSMLLATVPVILTFSSGYTQSNSHLFLILSALFPPVNYISFLSCFAGWEAGSTRINLNKNLNQVLMPLGSRNDLPIGGPAAVKGSVYWAFAVMHIVAFPLLAMAVEWAFFSVRTGGRRVPLKTNPSSKVTTPLGIKLTGFSRNYGKVKAVDGLDLDVYRGEIICLLGANGSGKTTTLQAIAGIGGVDGGKIEISGLGRGGGTLSGVGVCPQGNVLWDSLTVEEHVTLWSNIKCAGRSRERHDDGDIIGECDLWKKRTVRSSTLSGGMKRKLQLAIMLVGGVEVCCMDEVSSGLDPLSRLKIHEIILANRGKRTILFTTHYLDEADLADSIAIISKGKLQCKGSPATLKSELGNGYKITSPIPVDGLSEWSVKSSADVGPLLRVIEEHEIEDYKVEAPTLEQVFLNVVANAKAIEDAAEKTTMLEGLGSSGRDVSFVRAQEAAPAPLHLSSSTTSNFWREMAAIYLKRWMIIRRSYIPVLAVFFIPIAVAVATRGLIGGYKMDDCVRSANQRRSLNNENQGIDIQGFPRSEDLNMYLNQYKSNRVLLAPTQSWGPKQIGAVQEVIGDYAYVANKIYSPDLADFKTQVEENFQTIPLALYYDTEGKQDILGVNMQLPIQYAAMPLNFMNQVRINASGSDLKIQPLVGTMIGSQNTPPGLGWAIIFVFFFGFAMAVAAAFPALYPTFERVRKVRALHYSNGVRPAPLWLGHLLYEGTFLVISGIICALIIATNNPSAWYQPLYLILIFALYAIASTLLSFVVSLFAKSALAAFPAMAGLNSLMHTIFMVIYLVLFTVGSAEELSGSLDHVFYALGCVFPIANLDRAVFVSLNLFSISCNPATAATRGNSGFRHTPIAFDLYGGPAVFLAVQSILYFLLLVWWELGRPLPIPRRRAKAGVVSLDPYSPLPTAALVVSSLSKRFGSSKTQAVSDLSFHVSANETFCLLGPNGAGKTTTLSMVLGEMHPDSGDILVAGKSVVRGHHRRSTKLSVCPQFDATDNLTVTQTLRFYARVKGVSHPKRNVDTLINAVGLERFVDTKADALSGGNRRKLSLAIALLGNPSVILLDEPSSGMDASAKRSMWATLKAVSPGRAVVLTTHSMEESTALASRVGILGGGRMRESGTVRELTERLGRWHHVQIVCDSAPHTKPAEIVELGEWVAAEFGVAAEEGGLGQMRFRVKASAWSVGEVFRRLEGREGVKYAVQETGLEDVFLAVGRRMEEEKEKEKVWEEEDM